MTMVRFGLTAVPSGQVVGQAWDALWIGMSAWDTFDIPTDVPNKTTEVDPIAFGGTVLWAPVPLAGLVTARCAGPAQYSEEDFTLDVPWNTIKGIELTDLDATTLNVTGFVDTWIAAAGDNTSHDINVTSAKRGAIDVGNGNNSISVEYLSNEYAWSNHFHIGVGDGNNSIYVQPEFYAEPNNVPVASGWTFNTQPDRTTVGIVLGSGNNKVELQECSGMITAGSGTSDISLVDGHNALALGSGTATVTVAAYDTLGPRYFAVATDRGSDIVQLGLGHADISIDDTMTFMTPLTTITLTHGQSGVGTTEGADDIRYGHVSGSAFVGGDWSALTLDLVGYSIGSSTTLTQAGDHAVLTIQDAAGGAADVLNLYGALLSSVATLHLHFSA